LSSPAVQAIICFTHETDIQWSGLCWRIPGESNGSRWRNTNCDSSLSWWSVVRKRSTYWQGW
jgi:hypothetical protein